MSEYGNDVGSPAFKLMPFGKSELEVPEGQKKIAQRFNAGNYATPVKVPKGRLKHGNDRFIFGRPFGTRIQSTPIPALKRRAIIGMSLRDTFPLNFRKALAFMQWKPSRLKAPEGGTPNEGFGAPVRFPYAP